MRVGIIGASGLVGDKLIKLLLNNGYFDIKICASLNSEGKIINYISNDVSHSFEMKKLDEHFFEDINVAFFCSDNSVA